VLAKRTAPQSLDAIIPSAYSRIILQTAVEAGVGAVQGSSGNLRPGSGKIFGRGVGRVLQ
jgi:hypothetical protein